MSHDRRNPFRLATDRAGTEQATREITAAIRTGSWPTVIEKARRWSYLGTGERESYDAIYNAFSREAGGVAGVVSNPARKRPPPASGTLPADHPLVAAAPKLYAWAKEAFGNRAVRDVLVWSPKPDRLKVAFYGDARSMLGRFGFADGSLNNENRWLDRSFARAFGVDLRIRWSTGNRVIDIDPDLSHEDGDVGPGAILQAVQNMIRDEILGHDDPGVVLDVTLLPDVGAPWYGAGTVYYSGREGRWIAGERPPWVVEVTARDPDTSRDVRRPGADWCAIAPRVEPAYERAPGFATAGASVVMVTHAFDMSRGHDDQTHRDIASCGGLLFPSVAVGPIPAANFGPCVLVADPMTVVGGLKPYRQRGAALLAPLYTTDAYTQTTREFRGALSARLYDELTGATDEQLFLLGGRPHLYALGPPVEHEDDGPEGKRLIQTTSQMLTALRRRFKLWNGPMDAKAFARVMAKVQREDLGRDANEFAYLEGKVHAVMPMTSFVAAWVPDFGLDVYSAFLRGAGFVGPIHVMATSEAERHSYLRTAGVDADGLPRYNYAWRVAEQVRAKTRGVEIS